MTSSFMQQGCVLRSVGGRIVHTIWPDHFAKAESDLRVPFHAQKSEQPNAHVIVTNCSGDVLARASIWWHNQFVESKYQSAGMIGHYEASEHGAALEVLFESCKLLAQRGCRQAIGPINGNTWRQYRFMTEAGSEPRFSFEPWNPLSYPRQWQEAGFNVLAQYASSLNVNLAEIDPKAPRLLEDFLTMGLTFRSIDLEQADRELEKIYDCSIQCFARNMLYSPISKAEFVARYGKALPIVIPELVTMVEQGDELVGFMFAVPDCAELPRLRLVMKTIARLPRPELRGLGRVLFHACHQHALEFGFSEAIHALYLESNISAQISRHYGESIRKYSLFTKQL